MKQKTWIIICMLLFASPLQSGICKQLLGTAFVSCVSIAIYHYTQHAPPGAFQNDVVHAIAAGKNIINTTLSVIKRNWYQCKTGMHRYKMEQHIRTDNVRGVFRSGLYVARSKLNEISLYF